MADPQYKALGSIACVEDPELGAIRMQNVMYRLTGTPGSIRWSGRGHGENTYEILSGSLGLDEQTIDGLYKDGVI